MNGERSMARSCFWYEHRRRGYHQSSVCKSNLESTAKNVMLLIYSSGTIKVSDDDATYWLLPTVNVASLDIITDILR